MHFKLSIYLIKIGTLEDIIRLMPVQIHLRNYFTLKPQITFKKLNLLKK